MKKFHDLFPVDIAIWRVSHHHRHLVHSRLESMGLYRGQHRLIMVLSESDGLTHSQLAESMRISNATISKMVQRMEHTGFVSRKPDPRDQRISRVFLTEKGTAIHEQIMQMFMQLQADEIEGFSEEEVKQLMDFLQRVNENLLKHFPHHDHKPGKKPQQHISQSEKQA